MSRALNLQVLKISNNLDNRVHNNKSSYKIKSKNKNHQIEMNKRLHQNNKYRKIRLFKEHHPNKISNSK